MTVRTMRAFIARLGTRVCDDAVGLVVKACLGSYLRAMCTMYIHWIVESPRKASTMREAMVYITRVLTTRTMYIHVHVSVTFF